MEIVNAATGSPWVHRLRKAPSGDETIPGASRFATRYKCKRHAVRAWCLCMSVLQCNGAIHFLGERTHDRRSTIWDVVPDKWSHLSPNPSREKTRRTKLPSPKW